MKGIYKFEQDYGRMGYLDGVFIAESVDVKQMLGNEVDLGEVLGKHSEVITTMTSDNITLLTDDQDFIKTFSDILSDTFEAGINPMGYYLDAVADGCYN